MSENSTRREMLKKMAATGVAGAGLAASTGLASAGSQTYTVRIDQAGYSDGSYKLRMKCNECSITGQDDTESEDNLYLDGDDVVIDGYVPEGTSDTWDCEGVGDLRVIDSETSDCDVYQDGQIVGSY